MKGSDFNVDTANRQSRAGGVMYIEKQERANRAKIPFEYDARFNDFGNRA